MASKEFLIISSSPPKAFTTYGMSSSPVLPSPNEVFAKKIPVFRTGSRASPIPQNAIASFTSASSLLQSDSLHVVDIIRSLQSGPEDDGTLQASRNKSSARNQSRKPSVGNKSGAEGKVARKPQKTTRKDNAATDGAAAKKPRKAPMKEVDEEMREHGAVKTKAPSKSRAKKLGTGDVTSKGKAARKPKPKKSDGDNQTKLPNAQVTKVLISTEEGHHVKSQDNHGTTEIDPVAGSLDYGLAEAVRRRTNWTPPPLPIKPPSLTTPGPADLLEANPFLGDLKSSEEKDNGFQDLLGSFGFSKLDDRATDKILLEEGGTRKRKLIELVKTNGSALTKAPKPKAPKKRPKTITEQATSAYAEEENMYGKQPPLMQYFSLDATDRVTSDGFKIPSKARSKSPVKRGKGTAEAPILLSPESALKQVGNQDFVFGTSSQLAREESPGFLRDIHAAMQASNELDRDDPFTSPVLLEGKSKVLPSMKRSLWSAAARDGTGQLLDVEMADVVGSPAMQKQLHTAASLDGESSHPRKDDDEDPVQDPVETPIGTESIEESSKHVGPVEAAIRLELLSSPLKNIENSDSPAEPSVQNNVVSLKKPTKAHASKEKNSGRSKSSKRPEFSAYTMVQLAKEIASYHFKPIKSRDQMIALLEKCWDAKQQRSALGNLATNLPVSSPKKLASVLPPSSQPQITSPKRPRGRPRKDNDATPSPKRKTKTASLANALSRARKTQKKAEALDEISDSDVAQTPSPPRRHPSQIGTPPLPLQLSSSASVDSRELSPTTSQIRLFKYITAAVKTTPPATDPSSPSWYEKMLLYDPIIIEDLTVWLNTGALEKAGWDGEVDPKEVKKWCESKSVCCLWKENLRGGSRSRY
ncbi:Structure-specific endonuclease subunit slx4 [Hyphodiscus hymeniophilus]|uniref:Structure-specific endonuclease subunit SLX4 n=1 Tax=Hyphodiscus hymeniophilus TaxID=353542 RepID=A0A9P7AZ13_9HELO|nr:Structure-specific endonuclease subunit slx4 [Hyphodiscus hymeniophilus]